MLKAGSLDLERFEKIERKYRNELSQNKTNQNKTKLFKSKQNMDETLRAWRIVGGNNTKQIQYKTKQKHIYKLELKRYDTTICID